MFIPIKINSKKKNNGDMATKTKQENKHTTTKNNKNNMAITCFTSAMGDTF
jgi:hypothetical protein